MRSWSPWMRARRDTELTSGRGSIEVRDHSSMRRGEEVELRADDGVLRVPADALPEVVAAREAGPEPVRWVWDDTTRWYPALLAAGVRVARCTDLRLCHALLRRSPRPGADRVRAGIAATRAALPRAGLPVLVIHGTDDGLIPPAFSSAPYVAAAKAAGREVNYWQVKHVQHFDGFLGLPDYGARYLPLLPYVYTALDRVDAYLDGKAALPDDAVIHTVPRMGKPLATDNLAMPH